MISEAERLEAFRKEQLCPLGFEESMRAGAWASSDEAEVTTLCDRCGRIHWRNPRSGTAGTADPAR